MNYQLNRDRSQISQANPKRIVFTMDLAGNFKSVNRMGECVFGYSGAEMCGMSIVRYAAPEFADFLAKQIAQAAQGQVGAVYEIEIVRKDGQRVFLETSMRLVSQEGAPFELHGLAFPQIHFARVTRPRCVDESFTFDSALNVSHPLTF